MFTRTAVRNAHQCLHRRTLTTLPNSPHIMLEYVFPDERTLSNSLLTLLPTSPPTPLLALGTTPTLPPTPSSFTANPHFLSLLNSVLAESATSDPTVIASAAAYTSSAGTSLGSGGRFFPGQRRQQRKHQSAEGNRARDGVAGKIPAFGGGDGAGGASAQGGAGGGSRGGFVHVYDERHPPDFGRIPEPEDIFGSVEVDGEGNFVDGDEVMDTHASDPPTRSPYQGRFQPSGTYRVVTNHGILGLSAFLRGKMVERLRVEEDKTKRGRR